MLYKFKCPTIAQLHSFITLCLILFVSMSERTSAADPIESMPRNFYEILQRGVTFLFIGNDTMEQPVATGFLIGVPVEQNGNSGHIRFLVSARHVLNPTWAKLPEPSSLYARFNVKGQNRTVKYQLPPAGSSTLIEPDDDTDLAVAFIAISDELDILFIKAEDFMSDEELRMWNIGVGAEVVTAALLTLAPGSGRNYPVAKFGRVSCIPEEPISVHFGSHEKAGKYWLLELNQLGGNSGAPIFLKPSDLKVAGGLTITAPPTKIIGISTTQFLSGTAGMIPIKALELLLRKKVSRILPPGFKAWPVENKAQVSQLPTK